jgi:hypothetical protein
VGMRIPRTTINKRPIYFESPVLDVILVDVSGQARVCVAVKREDEGTGRSDQRALMRLTTNPVKPRFRCFISDDPAPYEAICRPLTILLMARILRSAFSTA